MLKISEAMPELPAAIKHEAHIGCPHNQKVPAATDTSDLC